MATEGEPEDVTATAAEEEELMDEGDMSHHQSAFLTPLNESLADWEGDEEQEVEHCSTHYRHLPTRHPNDNTTISLSLLCIP